MTQTTMGDDLKENYQRKIEAEITDRVMASDVSPERRDVITKKGSYAARPSLANIENEARGIERQVEELAYIGKSPLMQVAYRVAFKTRVMHPFQVLAKDRSELEKRIRENRDEIGTLMQEVNEFDQQFAEKRKWVLDGKLVYDELKSKKDQHEAEMAQEEAESEECKKTFYNSQDKAEREQSKQLFNGYQQSKQLHEKAIRELDREMDSTLSSFNQFYDDLEDLKLAKGTIEQEVEGLEADARNMEDYSRQLRPFSTPNGGSIDRIRRLREHQIYVDKHIKPLAEGLQQLYDKQRGIVKKVPQAYDERRKQRRKAAGEELKGSSERTQDERKLALERMESLNLI